MSVVQFVALLGSMVVILAAMYTLLIRETRFMNRALEDRLRAEIAPLKEDVRMIKDHLIGAGLTNLTK